MNLPSIFLWRKKMSRIVIALGGNALQESGKPATAQSQLEVVEKTSEYIADIINAGYDVVLAHGNGPQVGRIVLQNEHSADITPALPFDVCGAMSQGYIGYHMQQGLEKVLRHRGINKRVATIVTQVVVDKNDPKSQNPSKPIGPFYTEEEAKRIEAEKGYTMKEDAGRGWRRVVASPNPIEIVELNAVKCLIDGGFIAITVGGGGIPVIKDENGNYVGTAAVIDKDLASERLAEGINADALVILTAVETASISVNPIKRHFHVLIPKKHVNTLRKVILPRVQCFQRLKLQSNLLKASPAGRQSLLPLIRLLKHLRVNPEQRFHKITRAKSLLLLPSFLS